MWVYSRDQTGSIPVPLPIKDHLGKWIIALAAGLGGAIVLFMLHSWLN